MTALTLGYVEWTSPEVRVRADEEARVPEARLPAGGGEEPGPWTLAVHVATEAGEPVEGALVRVFRRRERGDGGQELRRQETSGRTDAGGRIELEGAILGSKQIVVDGRDAGFALWERPLDLKTAGARADLAATLQPGLEIRGTVRTPDGSPPGELQVYAFDDPAQWRHGTLGSDGRFVIRGLDSGTYHLHVRGHRTPWSPVHRAVLAGTDVELVLKRADDPRDVGDHAAELHGHLVDRATGAPLALDLEAVGLRWAKPGSAWADVAPLALAPSMAQQSREMGWEPPPPSSAFHLTGLDAGTYLVVARAPGKAPAVSGPFELAAGALLSGIVLELGPGAELRGRVLDVDGGELHGVHVVLLGRGPESARQLAEWDRELRSNRGRGVQLLPSLGCWCSQCAGEGGRVKLRRIPAGMAVRVGALHPDREPVLADLPAATDGAVLEADLRFRAKR